MEYVFAASMDTIKKTDVSVGLKTNKSKYQAGEPVIINIEAVNKSGKAIKSYYPSSQRYDLIVTDQKGKKVWQWSQGKMFLMQITPFQLDARGKISFKYAWSQKDGSGKLVRPGKYKLKGIIKLAPDIETKEKSFTIQGSSGKNAH